MGLALGERLEEKANDWLVPALCAAMGPRGFIWGYCLPHMPPLPFPPVVTFFLLPAES